MIQIRPFQIALLGLLVGLTGCLDDNLECAFDDRLELQPPKETLEGVVGTPIAYTVTAAVARSPHDDDHKYRFRWDEESLPPGLKAEKSGRRTWVIAGTPRLEGSWGVALYASSPSLKDKKEREEDDDRDDGDLFVGNCIDFSAEGYYLFNISDRP